MHCAKKKKLWQTVKKADEWKKEGGQMRKKEDRKRQEASITRKVQMCQLKQIRKEEGKKEILFYPIPLVLFTGSQRGWIERT